MMCYSVCDKHNRVCWCVSRKDKRLLLKLLPVLSLVYVTGKLYCDIPSSHNELHRQPERGINIEPSGWANATASPEADVLNIVSLTAAPSERSKVTAGNVPFNVSVSETVSCWRRLRLRLGRPAHLVVIGDSRARGLYHHLRDSWRLTAHTQRGSQCLEHFVYKNRTDWCHYHASSPHVDLRFFWCRLADSALLKVLETLRADCEVLPASCPHLLLLSLGTHQLTAPESTISRRLLSAVTGLEMTAVALEKMSDLGVRVFWKLSEPENFEQISQLTDSSLNYAHATYNAMLVDRLEQLAPSVRRWSSVLPPTENYIARCRVDPTWYSKPYISPLRNCYDRLHYGEAVQDQYRSQLQRHLCPVLA